MRMSAIIGHRGAARLAPENTLAGIRTAAGCGLSWVELDVVVMGDGSLIVHHDSTLDRCTNAKGNIRELGIEDLQGVDAGVLFHNCSGVQFKGEPVPSLRQALDLTHSLGMGMNLEIKMHKHPVEDLVRPVLQELEGHPVRNDGRLIISSFDHQALLLCKQQQSDIPVGHLFDRLPTNWLDKTRAVNAVTVHVNHRKLTKKTACDVLLAGYELYCYTVNDVWRAAELFSWGVSGVFTDDPDQIRAALKRP